VEMELAVDYVNQILIFVIFTASLNLLMGYAGQISVAHGAFAGIGGYSLAYLFLNNHVSAVQGIAVGVVIAALAGLALGVPSLRLTTEWLILLTLAAQIIAIAFAMTSSSLGGTYGLQNIAPVDVFGTDLLFPTDMLPVFAVCALVVLLICWRMGESPYGRVLRGIREDEVACRSLGKNVFAYKLTVFAVTAGMAGLGGGLYVVNVQIASPTLFNFDLSMTIIAMMILGGMGNLLGSCIGATALVLVTPFFETVLGFDAQQSGLWRLVAYGLVLVVAMLVRPQGMLPEGVTPLSWLAARTRPGSGARRTAGESAPPGTVPADHLAPALPDDNSVSDAALDGLRRGDADQQHEVVLEVRGLTKRFGGIVAADDLNMDLQSGMVTALVGPNGAGKTTVFNLLTGAIPCDAGRVMLRGRDISTLRPDQVTRQGMVRSFQDVRVFPRLSALQNVMLAVQDQPGEHLLPLFGRVARTARAERRAHDLAMDWLGFVGVQDLADQPAGALAFGQQKLVAVARVLAADAEVLLLDEPASGIDRQWVDAMLSLIERLRGQGRTICIVEHNLHVVGSLADHVYFMELGRITAQGTFGELTGERRLAEAYFGTG
jgi:branched-chain amino acid transport system permease protein